MYFHPEADGGRGFWVITKFDDVRAVLKDYGDLLLGARRSGADRGPARGRARRAAQLPRVRSAQARPLPAAVLGRLHPDAPCAATRSGCASWSARAWTTRCARGEFDLVERARRADPDPRARAHPRAARGGAAALIELGDRLLVDTEPEFVGELAYAGEQDEYRYKPFGSPWAEELCALGRAHYAERRACPRDDVLSLIANGTVDGRPLDARELDNMFALMVVAGNETTRQAIALSTLALARHPEGYAAAARAIRELMGSAVEELLRFCPPVWFFRRTATAATADPRGRRSPPATRSRCGSPPPTATPTTTPIPTASTSRATRPTT